MWGKRSARGPALLAAVVLVSWLGAAPAGSDLPSSPNVVIVVVDDLRFDTLGAMPNVRDEIALQGVEFRNGFVVNPSCCPSRTSLLTGKYSHSTGVWRNQPPYGGFDSFDDSSTLATRLHDAGYETALIGKYLNGYRQTSYVPPGWDRWVAFQNNVVDSSQYPYFSYGLNVDGTLEERGTDEADYSTDMLAAEAVDFVSSARRPFFLLFSPGAVHGPAIPASRHAGYFETIDSWRPDSFDESDVSDKPEWLQRRDRLDARSRRHIDAFRRRQLETLLAVDEAVDSIVEALRASGQLEHTLIAFTSDNGYLWGEHRLFGKGKAYEESIRVPLLIRYDALIPEPAVRDDLALNIDLAPTIVELAGADGGAFDGVSLAPALAGTGDVGRDSFAIEHLASTRRSPSFCALRTKRYLYVVYEEGKNELYALAYDRLQLRNRIHRAKRDVVARFRERLAEICDPPPPGFDREL